MLHYLGLRGDKILAPGAGAGLAVAFPLPFVLLGNVLLRVFLDHLQKLLIDRYL